MAIPKYRLHAKTGQAVVTLGGKDVYLGKHSTEASWRKYDDLVGGLVMDAAIADERAFSVSDVLAAAWKLYGSEKPQSKQLDFRKLASVIRRVCGSRPARDFGPLNYRRVREEFAKEKSHRWAGETWPRQRINGMAKYVREVFKWAASYELVPGSVPMALRTVEAVKRSPALRENEPIRPPSPDVVNAILAVAPPILADMLKLQLLTGMRSGELVRMRGCDLETGGGVWLYRPPHHKTEIFVKDRIVPLGPKARDIVTKYLTAKPADYLFTTEQSRRQFYLQRRKPVKLRREVRRAGRDAAHVDRDSYRVAIRYLGDRAFPVPADIADDRKSAAAWRRAHRFFPHQLRHAFATEVRAEFGLDMARQMLGHLSLRTTGVYAEADGKGMAAVAKDVG